MNIANVKGMVAKGLMTAVAAGALMFAGPAKAEAQGFAVGVQFGAPYHGYYGRGYYDNFEFRRREEFRRHEEWLRAHRFERPYGYR